MKRTNRVPALILLLALSLILSWASPQAAQAGPELQIPLNQALVLEGTETTNPREYDPATTHTAGDKRVFSGLVALDPNLNLIPDLAERWELSPNGTVYTFYLRKNARFHDGRPVTVQDVIYSWERAADPKLASDTVLTYLGDIVGVRDKYYGRPFSPT